MNQPVGFRALTRCGRRTLRELANSGKTILMTIHQPSLEAYVRFDTVAVIARDKSTKQVGRLAWYGRAWPEAIDFFDPRDSESQPPVNVDGLLRGLGRKPIAEWVRRWEASTAKSIWVDRRINGTKSAGVLRRVSYRVRLPEVCNGLRSFSARSLSKSPIVGTPSCFCAGTVDCIADCGSVFQSSSK